MWIFISAIKEPQRQSSNSIRTEYDRVHVCAYARENGENGRFKQSTRISIVFF